MIDEVEVRELKKFCNDQGCVYKMLSENDSFFDRFGEIYFSLIHSGIIKGWNVHTRQDANMACISGNIELVLYDRRQNSSSEGAIQKISLGEDHYSLVHIPHGVAYSWKAFGGASALIANCATLPHNPEESIKIALDSKEIPYQWQ